MEIQLTLKDVPVEGGTGCELSVAITGDMPTTGNLADQPSVAFLIAIQHLHRSGEYLDIAADVLAKNKRTDHGNQRPDQG